MTEVLLELAKHGGIVWLFVVGVGAVLFNAGVTWTQFRYMRTSMITKKDMQIGLLKFKEELNEDFVPRSEFQAWKEAAALSKAKGAHH